MWTVEGVEEECGVAVGDVGGGAWVVAFVDRGGGLLLYYLWYVEWYRGGLVLVKNTVLTEVVGIWLRHCLNGDQDKFDLIWPSLFSLPDIRRKKALEMNGNGRARGRNGEVRKRV